MATVRVEFVGQPVGPGAQIGHILRDGFRDSRYTSFWFATAWAKRSGLSRFHSALRSFLDRGGSAEGLIGVDEGGATWEGIELAASMFDPLFIYHDPGTRTFHPKLYVLEGDDFALSVIGSGNLTKGGLFTNYEAALSVHLDLSSHEDVACVRSIRDFYEYLKANPEACQPYSADLMERLALDPRIRISSEEHQLKRLRQRRSAPAPPSVFGSPVSGLQQAPPSEVEALPDEDADEDILAPEIVSAVEQPEEQPAGVIGFWKALSSWDVNPHSAPGQIVIPIRFLDFFPELELQFDDTEAGGTRQSHAEFAVRFVDGYYSVDVPSARVILYEPAATHARQNKELRFTFHDREVFSRLNEGDLLVFTRAADGPLQVERREAGAMGEGRYGIVG